MDLLRPGALLTTAALTYASVQLRKGNRALFQSALRWRVAFQTATVAAAAVSLFYLKQPKSRVPPPGPDGKAQPLEPWNPEKIAEREALTEAEWRARFAHAQNRDVREEEAVRRMIDEAVEKRTRMQAGTAPSPDAVAAAAPPASASVAPPPVPEARTMPKIGQDKRSWTFS